MSNPIDDIHPSIKRTAIAKRLNVSKQFINNIEHGRSELPDDKRLMLAQYLMEISNHTHKQSQGLLK